MSDEDEARSLSRRQFIQVSAASLVVPPTAALVSEGLAAAPLVAAAPAAGGQTTVARYIVARLVEHGVKVLFGVPAQPATRSSPPRPPPAAGCRWW